MPRSLFPLVALTILVLTGCSGQQQEPTTTPQPTPTATLSTSTTSTTAPPSSESTTTQTSPADTPMQSPEPQQQQPAQQAPAYQAPAAPPAQVDNGVSGYTGAPNGAPQPLDKAIAYCMNDPIYQPGTTTFTDGTTGWTTYCAGM